MFSRWSSWLARVNMRRVGARSFAAHCRFGSPAASHGSFAITLCGPGRFPNHAQNKSYGRLKEHGGNLSQRCVQAV